MKASLIKVLYAEAAHCNPHGAEEKQRRLHGHSYRIAVCAQGEVAPDIGWVVDFAELKALFAPVYSQLDHGYLNEIDGLEDDTRLGALQRWVEQQVSPAPAWYAGVRVAIEGDLAYRPVRLPAEPEAGLPERVRFTFEAAQSLPQLAPGHPCRRIHGHSYLLEAGGPPPGELERALADLYDDLDHTCLNEIPGLEQATCERVCRWVWEWLEARRLAPEVVVTQETPSAKCIYRGG